MALTYLGAYLALPDTIRQPVSTPQAIQTLSAVEKKYEVKLGAFVMRLLIGEISWAQLGETLQKELRLPSDKALALADELKKTYLAPIASVLNSTTAPTLVLTKVIPTDPSVLSDGKVMALISLWKKKAPTDPLLTILYGAVQGKDLVAAVAALRVLAEKNVLSEILKREGRLETLLADAYHRVGREQEAESLKLSPTNPRHIRNFVKMVLEQVLRMQPRESAHVAVDVVNLSNRDNASKLAPWAYYDMATQCYQWL